MCVQVILKSRTKCPSFPLFFLKGKFFFFHFPSLLFSLLQAISVSSTETHPIPSQMSLEDPLKRIREIDTQAVVPARKRSKKMMLDDEASTATAMTNDDEFTEKMYSAYVKSAFTSLEKVCCYRQRQGLGVHMFY